MQSAVAEPHQGQELVAQVHRRLTRAGWIANGLGALDTFVFAALLVPAAFGAHEGTTRLLVINAAVFAVVMVLAFWISERWARRRMAPLRGWIGVRPPTPEEREHALGLPLAEARMSASWWAAAAILFGAINATADPAGGVIVAITLVLGGITTSSYDHLLSERILRPVTTAALAAGPRLRPVGPSVRGRVTTVWLLATGVPLLGIAAVATAGLLVTDIEREVLAAAVLFLSAWAAGAGFFATGLAARSLGDSLAGIRHALARIEEGVFDVEVSVDDASEVGELQYGFNRMAAGLRERERLHDLFGRHVGRDVASAALLDTEVRLGGEVREVGVLFVDLVGSTAMAAKLPPERVVGLLNRFFRLIVDVVERHGGSVNKFEGDGALCVFGAPVERSDPAGAALAAGRELHARLVEELSDVDAGIGVSAGQAVAGNVGAMERFEYTVIGDPVNEASRLSELAKLRPERLVASDTAVKRAGARERGRWELGEAKTLRGRDEPTRLATVAAGAGAPLA